MISTRSKYFVRILMTQVAPIFVLSGLLQSQSVAQSVSFIARRDFVPGGSIVAAADMNNDGKADVIVTNTSTATLSVMLGKGDGTFQPAIVTNFASGQSPAFVVVADINVDGKPDVVTLTQFNGTGSVLIGRGDGSFQPPINFTADFQAAGIAAGDFNGDGRPDLAVTSANSFPNGTVSVSLGNGNGTFGPRQSFPVGNSPASVALGDLNGDGNLDVAVANTSSNSVSVLLGMGNGALLPAINTAVDGSPRSLTITDFDGDHKPDLAAVLSNLDEISILAGNGDGTFQFPLNIAVSPNPVFMTAADFNGDQIPDLVIAHSTQSSGAGSMSILAGIGDGSFQAPASYALNGSSTMLAVGDFNGDGFRDVVSSQPSLSFSSSLSDISEFFGKGDGTFQSAAKINIVSPNSVAVVDFDGNGYLDLAVVSFPNVLSIFMGNGDGTFRAGTSIALNFSAGLTPPVVGDFNNDKIPDLALASSSIIAVLLGNGDGTFQAPRILNTNINPTSMAVADFNSDGNLDLMAGGPNFSPGMVGVFLGNGNGTFQAPKSFTTANAISALATGEFNGDGRPDLVTVGSNTNSVSVFLGNGDGTFSQLGDIPVGRSPIAVAVGDMNGDGFADIGTANSSSSNVSILLGNGRGGFQAAFNFAVPGNPSFLTFGDFNHDGRLDVAVANSGANTVSVLLNASSSFIFTLDEIEPLAVARTLPTSNFEIEPFAVVRTSPAANFGVGASPAGLVTGDFNGDLLPDLITVDRGSNGLSVLINNTKITP